MIACLGLALVACLAQQASPPVPEHVAAIRVHGNHTTPDDEVVRLSGLTVGQTLDGGSFDAAAKALDKSGRFRSVDVRKRYTTLTDMSAILVVIVVEEQAGIAIDIPQPGPLRKLRASTMFMPILRSDDGYGFTYGARFSFVDVLGRRTRLSVPLSWGGERRATVELERRFEHGPFSRILAHGGVTRREHPSLDIGDRRAGGGLRVERSLGRWFRVGGGGSTWDVAFGEFGDRLSTLGADVVVDTRRDPAFPRNAVYGSLGVERLWFDGSADTTRLTADARGFLGLFGQSVLAVRAFHTSAADPLPSFEQAMLGGDATLRGFKLGYRMGDRLLAGSAEVRVPLGSPRRITRLGIAIFADAGTVHGADERLDEASWDRGYGAGVFIQGPLLGMRLDVARGVGSGTRVHFNLGATF